MRHGGCGLRIAAVLCTHGICPLMYWSALRNNWTGNKDLGGLTLKRHPTRKSSCLAQVSYQKLETLDFSGF